MIGDSVTEEDRVVHLLASLPDLFNMLVTALEANLKTVPKMENVTEIAAQRTENKGKGNGRQWTQSSYS